MTLHDFYFKTVNEKPHLADCKWKIVDKHTRKNLCGDFATCDYLTCASCEEKSVWSSAVNTTKNGVVYVRVTVYDPIKFPTKPKEEPAAEETAPVQPAEQAQEAESVVETVVEPAEAPAETEDETETVPEYPKYYVESFFTGWKRVTKEQYENWREHVRNGATAQTKEGIENILARRTRVICSTEEDTPENNPLYVAYNIPNHPEPMPAETVPESAGDTPEEVPETAGFHPIINNLPQKSKWDVWNVRPDEYLSSCVVPLVRCDENYHVLDTVYLKVGTPEEVKTLMSAAAVGNRRRWPKYNKQYRRETVQRAADIIEKYYI